MRRGRQGNRGAKGFPGEAATIAIGAVTTGAPGSLAEVTNVGTSSAAVLDFTIPAGTDGTNGLDGDPGGAASPADLVATPTPTSATLRWPPGVQVIGPEHRNFRLRVLCNKRFVGGAVDETQWRKAEIKLDFYGVAGAQVFNVTQHAPEKGWIKSVAPLTAWGNGSTVVTVTPIAVANGQWYLSIACSIQVPAHAPNGVAWAVDGAEIPSNAIQAGV